MGVIVNKNEQENELSRRISADLRERAMETAKKDDKNEDVDLAEDAEYMKNLKKTSKFGWIWIVLIVLAVLSIISIIFI